MLLQQYGFALICIMFLWLALFFLAVIILYLRHRQLVKDQFNMQIENQIQKQMIQSLLKSTEEINKEIFKLKRRELC